MYYFKIEECRNKNNYCKYLKKECKKLINPFIGKISKTLNSDLTTSWTTRSTFGYVLCDFIPEKSGAKLISKGAKRFFELVKDEVDFLVLSKTSEKLVDIKDIKDSKVMVVNIKDFKWFMKTFSNQKNAANLILNRFSGDDAKLILKWFRSSIGQMKIKEVKEIIVDVGEVGEEEIVNAVKKNPSLMLEFAKKLDDSDFDVSSISEFSTAIYHIQNLISSKQTDKLKGLIETLKDEDPATIENLNEHLKYVTLESINKTIAITRDKIESLNQFKSMLENPNTYEVKGYGSSSVHEFLENNPWFMGKTYELFSSNKRTKEIVKKDLPKEIANLKPDFVLLKRKDKETAVVLEIKRPKIKLGVNHVEQVFDYEVILRKHMPNIKKWIPVLVGKLLSNDLELRKRHYNLEIKTYTELYSECEDDLNEYLEVYKEKKKELSPEKKKEEPKAEEKKAEEKKKSD